MGKDEFWMSLAICESEKALRKGEVPVGAVIVKGDRLVSKAHNLTSKNPLFHAEILAMLKADTKDLRDSSVYVTVEPCIMCSGALVLAKVKEVIFSIPNEKFGGTYTLYQIPLDTRLNHRVVVRKGPFGERVKTLMEEYFGKKRLKGD
ncbi:MAG: nucleoside deaminase [candidate division WOR-3 bacterium]